MYYTDRLGTPRLITRFITTDDIGSWIEYCSDPEATRFTALPGMTQEEMAEFVINKTINRYAAGRGGLQALISKDTGELVGQCGLMIQDVNGTDELEVGYHLLRRHWHKGYAIEAAKMFRNYAFERYATDSVVSIIRPDNIPSQQVALRNGMRVTQKDVKCFGGRHDIYRITRSEWERLHTASS